MEKKSEMVYKLRRDTLKRKASELSSLCNVKVCLLCFCPNGDFTSWPENPSEAIQTIQRASVEEERLNCRRRRTETLNLSDFMDMEIKSLRKATKSDKDPLFLCDDQLDLLPKESLLSLFGSLESKILDIDSRIRFLGAQGNQTRQFRLFQNVLEPVNNQVVDENNVFILDNKEWVEF